MTHLNSKCDLRNLLPVGEGRQTVDVSPEVGGGYYVVEMQVIVRVEFKRRRAALGPGPEGRPADGGHVGREVVQQLLDLVGVLRLPVQPRPRHAVVEVQRPLVDRILQF